MFGQFVGALEREDEVSKKMPGDYGSPDFSQWKKDDESQWQKVIDAGRKYLGGCPDGSVSAETSVLEQIARGLSQQGHVEEAIPILRRCLSLDLNKSSCWHELGDLEFGSCRFDDAKAAYQKVIDVGGFTEVNAVLVHEAKSQISLLENPEALQNIRNRFFAFGRCSPADGNEAPTIGPNKRFGTGFFVSRQEVCAHQQPRG